MNIETQVCTIEQGKRLKELGIVPESHFMWEEMRLPVHNGCCKKRVIPKYDAGAPHSDAVIAAVYPAYSVAELGVMMPDDYIKHFDFPGYKIPESREYQQSFNQWFFNVSGIRRFGGRYDYNGNMNIGTLNFYGTEAEVRAGLLIHLLQNKLTTIEEVNSRLLKA